MTPTVLADNTTWYWRAKAGDGNADSDWMATASLFVNIANDAPSAPTVNYPADGSTVTVRTPQLSVNAAADVDNDSLTYEYEVYSDSGLTQLLSIEQGAGPSWIMSAVLTDNAWYYWRARAKDEHDEIGDWTAVTSFFVNNSDFNDSPTISVLSPGASDAVAYGTSHTIRWSDSDPTATQRSRWATTPRARRSAAAPRSRRASGRTITRTSTPGTSRLAYNTNYWVYAKIDDGAHQSCAYASNALIDRSRNLLTVMKDGAARSQQPGRHRLRDDCGELFGVITPVPSRQRRNKHRFTGWSGGGCGHRRGQTRIDQAKTDDRSSPKTYTVTR
jgi:hypothetical protein